eukprot:1218242-Prymnesium_polylepis.1
MRTWSWARAQGMRMGLKASENDPDQAHKDEAAAVTIQAAAKGARRMEQFEAVHEQSVTPVQAAIRGYSARRNLKLAEQAMEKNAQVARPQHTQADRQAWERARARTAHPPAPHTHPCRTPTRAARPRHAPTRAARLRVQHSSTSVVAPAARRSFGKGGGQGGHGGGQGGPSSANVQAGARSQFEAPLGNHERERQEYVAELQRSIGLVTRQIEAVNAAMGYGSVEMQRETKGRLSRLRRQKRSIAAELQLTLREASEGEQLGRHSAISDASRGVAKVKAGSRAYDQHILWQYMKVSTRAALTSLTDSARGSLVPKVKLSLCIGAPKLYAVPHAPPRIALSLVLPPTAAAELLPPRALTISLTLQPPPSMLARRDTPPSPTVASTAVASAAADKSR